MKKEKAITLIALVITIIILLILAGVTLNIVFNKGLIEKSQTAVDKYSEEQAREKLLLDILEHKMKVISGESDNDFETYIKETKGGSIDIENDKYKVTMYGYEFILDKETLEIETVNKAENQTPQEQEKPEEKTKYTVTINKGTGIQSVTETQQIDEGQSLEIAAEVASGYKFNKWEIKSGIGTIENEASATTRVTPEESIIIEATAETITEIIANGNNINGTEHGTITGGEYAYNNPVIPVGFKISTEGASWTSTNGTTVDGWNEGLVIQDGSGNQFVWVPVHNEAVVENGETIKALPYAKWCTTDVDYNNSNINDATISTEITETDQITEFKGFYVARYEAGIPTNDANLTGALTNADASYRNKTGKPVSKKNQIPWNRIGWDTAKENAESMYTTTKVKSGLITGTQWDTIMKWIENEETGALTSSVEWGNFSDAPVTEITEYSPHINFGASWTTVSSRNKPITGSTDEEYKWLLKTGHSEYTNRKNIYDLAGNLFEWSNEKYSSDQYVIRGGDYIYSRSEYSVECRINYNNVNSGGIGFRVVLYIL